MSTGNGPPKDEKQYWLDKPASVTAVYRSVVGVCAVLLLLDLFHEKHVESEIEHYFGFYGVYGFVCCVFLALAAKGLRKLVMRGEDYYDR